MGFVVAVLFISIIILCVILWLIYFQSTPDTLKLIFYALPFPFVYFFNQEKLAEIYERGLIDMSDAIVSVWKCKKALHVIQLTKLIFYHAFNVFETAKGVFLSIEKNQEGIVIQIGSNFDVVYKCFNGEHRQASLKADRFTYHGGKTVGDLFNWLIKEKEVKMAYKLSDKKFNCKGFAGRCLKTLSS
jgi:hypothetical protein